MVIATNRRSIAHVDSPPGVPNDLGRTASSVGANDDPDVLSDCPEQNDRIFQKNYLDVKNLPPEVTPSTRTFVNRSRFAPESLPNAAIVTPTVNETTNILIH